MKWKDLMKALSCVWCTLPSHLCTCSDPLWVPNYFHCSWKEAWPYCLRNKERGLLSSLPSPVLQQQRFLKKVTQNFRYLNIFIRIENGVSTLTFYSSWRQKQTNKQKHGQIPMCPPISTNCGSKELCLSPTYKCLFLLGCLALLLWGRAAKYCRKFWWRNWHWQR